MFKNTLPSSLSSSISILTDSMSKFLEGLFDHIVEKFHVKLLHDSIDISCLMVHAQKVVETRLWKSNSDAKRERPYNGGSSRCKLEIQDKPTFIKRFFNQSSPNVTTVKKDRVYISLSHNEENLVVHVEKLNCEKIGKRQGGKCLLRTNNFYVCGKSGNIRRDCPMLRA